MTELTRPTKPENYIRNSVLLYLVCVLLGLAITVVDRHLIFYGLGMLTGIWLPQYLHARTYREYLAAQVEYRDYQHEFRLSEKEKARRANYRDRDVNSNIRRYLKAERARKANAGWWEFWV